MSTSNKNPDYGFTPLNPITKQQNGAY